MVSTKTEPESELKVLKEQIERRAYWVEPAVVADAILRRLADPNRREAHALPA